MVKNCHLCGAEQNKIKMLGRIGVMKDREEGLSWIYRVGKMKMLMLSLFGMN